MKAPSLLQTFSRLLGLLNLRRKKASESAEHIPEDHTTAQAKRLHPGPLQATFVQREEEAQGCYRLTFDMGMPYSFAPGTYASLRLKVNGSDLARPYSIVNGPIDAEKGILEILVRDERDGFVAPYLCHELPLRSKLYIEAGLGEFHYDCFRDAKNLVLIAGGVGIAPFLAMAKALMHEESDRTIVVLRGAKKKAELLGNQDLSAIKDPRICVIDVLSDEPDYEGETGFIDAKILKRYSPEGDCTYFLCGPAAMETFVKKELASMGVPMRRIRSECFSLPKVYEREDYPMQSKGKTYKVLVYQGKKETWIDAYSGESLVHALERAGLYIRTSCRSGSCGACRLQVLQGRVYVLKEKDGGRHADKEFGYVHGCISYPLSDLKIRISIPPLLGE